MMKNKMKNPNNYCNKCNKYIINMNEAELGELKNEGSFVCSDCINDEMDLEEFNRSKMKSNLKIFLTKADLECLNEGEEITINNEIDIEVDEGLKRGRIRK